jgi:integrase
MGGTRKDKAQRAKRLTEADLKDAKPEAKAYRLSDAGQPEMKVRVQPTGRKLFELRYGHHQSKSYILGRWPGMTIEMAREAAKRTLVEIQIFGAPKEVIDEREAEARVADEALALQEQTTALQREADDRKAGLLIVSLGELIDHRLEAFLTTHQKSGQASVNRLRSVWADFLDKPMTDITAWEIEKHRSDRIKAGVSVGTTNRDLAVLKSALARAVEWDIITTHPLTKVKPKSDRHSGVVRFLGSIESDPKEEQRLRDELTKRDRAAIEGRQRTIAGNRLQHANLAQIPADGFADHLTPLVLVAMNTGLRRGELTSLTWADVDLTRKLVTVRSGYAKSGKARHVPLNSEAVDVLNRWQKQSTKGRVFDVDGIKTAWGALLVNAKVTEFRFHDLRHHFASRLVQAGVDLNTVRELLGHADLKMTLRYAHLAPSNTASAVERLVSPQ